MIDVNRRPMTKVDTRMPTYFAPGVKYITRGDGSIRRADPRPLEQAISQHRPRFRVTIAQAWSYIRAELSAAIRGPVSDQVYAARMAACSGCEHVQESPTDPVGLCGACGCGASPRAMLTVKGRMPEATCPLTPPRWSAADGIGPTWRSVAAAAAGIAASVRYVVRRPRTRVPAPQPAAGVNQR